MMHAAARFANALKAPGHSGDPRLLPDRLVCAAASVLPVDGVALGVFDEGFRLPLAASGAFAAAAERLEFTAGCGPGFSTSASGVPSLATEGLLAREWPILHDLLVTWTPLRAVLALPLPGRLRGVGGLDLYFHDPAGPRARDIAEAHLVAGLVAGQLDAVAGHPPTTGTGEPRWLATPAADRRGRVWMAVGMVIAALQLDADDALALLRAHAYATDATVDDLAEDLLARRIDPDELRGPVPTPRGPAGRQRDHRQGGTRGLVCGGCPGPPATGDGHVLLLHRGEAERQGGLAAWVRRGLELGEKVVCAERAVDPGHPEAALCTALEAAGVDVAAAIRAGRLDVLPAEEVRLPEAPSLVVQRALTAGFPAARLSIDAGAALSGLFAAEHRRNEHLIDELIRGRPLSVMCQYARATTAADRLQQVVAAHPSGVLESTLATGRERDRLTLRGEIDAANADVFAAVLAAVAPAASHELRLDLSGVTYLDAAAGRRLNDTTGAFRADGGRVVLVGPQPQVERTLALLDLGDLPGMQLAGAGR